VNFKELKDKIYFVWLLRIDKAKEL
jgi:hypothetical protein